MADLHTPSREPVRHGDVLVIGAGLAGLSVALSLPAHLRVTVLSKGPLQACASAWAQGGIAAVLDPADDLESHVQDTLVAGAGQCDEAVVRAIVAQAPGAIAWLRSLGVDFDRDEGGQALHLTREGGHSHRRIAHVADRTGQAVHAALLQACRARAHIELLEGHAALALVTAGEAEGARCLGARVRQPGGEVVRWQAAHTVLATGGLGQLFASTTNPDCATGDGVAMAWRAGCRVQDLEFIQFHPTALQVQGRAVGLVTEALRGEGALLRLPDGTRFMPAHDARAELAPRDVVARAIWHEMRSRGLPHVLLDISHRPRDWLQRHFPGVMQLCAAHGLDLAQAPIPVAPCAHYACGGVRATVAGRTDLPGLYAVGEVARTGLHGANRLASNSLLECVVMGRQAARHLVGELAPKPHAEGSGEPRLQADQLAAPWPDVQAMPDPACPGRSSSPEPAAPQGDAGGAPRATSAGWVEPGAASVGTGPSLQALRQLMNAVAGIQRNAVDLAAAAAQLAAWQAQLAEGEHLAVHAPGDPGAAQVGGQGVGPVVLGPDAAVRHALDVCQLIVSAALQRRHSCGAHARSDEPGESLVAGDAINPQYAATAVH
ncbi:L-aspartate oxidase [Comamonas serinivorans]|uniref:L-aspartate oxidase n=1 Tax=Comamonas serinivorans TaxID=1082851 RepID=A0A1Y0EMS3_9BURK|nr:L-aspartate oxidase [Comamonas serinivorans]ARU04964.1 L-aspartate oxidase [Comamonas serinivorans]